MPKAVQLTAYGEADQLTIIDVPKPVPAAGEVVVRVVAAGTNPGEISMTRRSRPIRVACG